MSLEVSTFKANCQPHEPHAEMSTACVTTLLPTTEQLCSCLLRTIRSKITAALLGTANTEPHTALCSWKIKPISGSAPKSISKHTRQHDIAEAVSFIHSFREVTKPFPLPIFLWPYRNRREFHTFPGQERENVTQIHSWDRSADVQNKIPVRYRLLQNHQRSSNPKRLASLCITKRTQKQCGNSILKSSTATSSGSFHHWYLMSKKKKKEKKTFISQCGLFYALLFELFVTCAVFFWFSMQPEGQELFFFFFSPQGDFKILLGFPLCVPIQRLNYVPAVRAAMCQTLSRSHAASLPYHTALWVVPPLLNEFLVLLVLALWPGDCLSKNAGPHIAEVQAMNRLQMLPWTGSWYEPWTKNMLQIIFLSPRDRGVKPLEMQDSTEAKKEHKRKTTAATPHQIALPPHKSVCPAPGCFSYF